MKSILPLVTLGLVLALVHRTGAEDHDCNKNSKLCKPEQIHVAFGEKINDITVTWSTMGDSTETLLKYGEGKMDLTVKGDNKIFVDGGSEKHSQWIHNVWLKDLKYNATYVYSVGSKFGWSDQMSFKTPPDGENVPVRVVIFGDMGIEHTYSLKPITEDVRSGQYDFSLQVGDFAYNFDYSEGRRGDTFMNLVQPFASILPYMVCVGNHESAYKGVNYPQSLKPITEDIRSGQYDFSLQVGDFAYNFDYSQGRRGDTFMNLVQPFASILPYMVCVGNHESAYNYSHYRSRFSMPGKTDNMYYSFDIGPVHFIALNTETYYNNTHYNVEIYPEYEHVAMVAQYEWLVNDLKEANKTENRIKRPWIITYGHRPFYCSNNWDGNDHCRNNDNLNSSFYYAHRNGKYGLETLLMEYRVDLEIWAHEHSYERMWPVYNKTVYNGSYEQPYLNPGAPVQFTTGSAGCHEYRDTFYSDPQPWSAFRSSDFGYTRLTIHNKTHIYMEELSTHPPDHEMKATQDSPKKIDEFWLVKDRR